MRLLSKLFGKVEKKSAQVLNILDNGIVEKESFLIKTAIEICCMNGAGSIEANVFELDGKGYVTHRFFYTLNKHIADTFSLTTLVNIVKNSSDRNVKADAIRKLMEVIDINETHSILEQLIHYFEMVKLPADCRIDDHMFQFYVTYADEIPITSISQYKDTIKNLVKTCVKEMGIDSDYLNVKDDGIKQQIEIKIR